MAATGSVLLTGGGGFFGGLLKQRLLADGRRVVSLDVVAQEKGPEGLFAVQGDIRDGALLDRILAEHAIRSVLHCAAVLAHAVKDEAALWSANVDGTRTLAERARAHGVGGFVFTSSNCLWGRAFDRPVTEDDPPEPVEVYGRSKWEGEQILDKFRDDMNVVVLRCPTIMEEGRLGLLAILFEFIDEGRKVWVVGGGRNRYQFIYAGDLVEACLLAENHGRSRVFNIGSDDVKSFREVYDHVIARAGTGARVASLPKGPTLLAMRFAHALKLSPLGPYQYKMIAEDFVFDTGRIKRELGWAPTLTNEEMLHRAYDYYHRNRREIEARRGVSAHKEAAKMGIIRLLKWLS